MSGAKVVPPLKGLGDSNRPLTQDSRPGLQIVLLSELGFSAHVEIHMESTHSLVFRISLINRSEPSPKDGTIYSRARECRENVGLKAPTPGGTEQD